MKVPNAAWPTRRGFERFFGTLTGCGPFFQPGTLTRGETNAEAEALDPDFYYTDAISDEAADFVRDCGKTPDTPFFLYVAYTAPHWPLHARDDDLARYRGAFDQGWDALREARIARQKAMGLIDADTRLSARDPSQPAWRDAPHRDWEARRMEAYAAQIDRMDQGIGRILEALDDTGARNDTLVIFLSDNGASDESLPLVELSRFRERRDILRLETREGRQCASATSPRSCPAARTPMRATAAPGPTCRTRRSATTSAGCTKAASPARSSSTGRPVNWRRAVRPRAGTADRHPSHDSRRCARGVSCGTRRPGDRGARGTQPAPGAARRNGAAARAVLGAHRQRRHPARAMEARARFPGAWELYDLEQDRTELHDLALREPRVVADLADAWTRWARRVGVIDWPVTLELYAARGQPAREAMG